jgi:cytochrome c
MSRIYRHSLCVLIWALSCSIAYATMDDAAAEAAFNAAGCKACHSPDKKTIGPSIQDIAAKYRDDTNALTLLTGKVRTGSAGVWGKIPMMPVSDEAISDTELNAVLQWMLNK